jgi:hypothetical protein
MGNLPKFKALWNPGTARSTCAAAQVEPPLLLQYTTGPDCTESPGTLIDSSSLIKKKKTDKQIKPFFSKFTAFNEAGPPRKKKKQLTAQHSGSLI